MCRTLALVPDIKQKDVVNRMYRVQITAVMSTFYSFADSVKSCVICSYLLSFLHGFDVILILKLPTKALLQLVLLYTV